MSVNKLGLAHVIASDAHEGAGVRICRLDDVYFMIKKQYSLSEAEILFHVNPTLLTKNQPLQPIIKPKFRFRLFQKFKFKRIKVHFPKRKKHEQ